MLDDAITLNKPIAGAVLPHGENDQPVMFAFYKLPKSRLGWLQLNFDDGQGAKHCGQWYAPMLVDEPDTEAPRSVKLVLRKAKLSAVAIPLRYAVAANHPQRLHYGVITNWWRERDANGNYPFPNLDFSLYPSPAADQQE